MKRTFQIIAMAILASSLLFGACKKDKDDSNNSDNPPVSTCPIQATFDGEALDLREYIFEFDVDPEAEQVEIYFAAAKATGSLDDALTGWELPLVVFGLQVNNPTGSNMKLSQIGVCIKSLNHEEPEWMFDESKNHEIKNIKIEQIDAQTGSISCEIHASVYSTEEVSRGVSIANATHKDLTIIMDKAIIKAPEESLLSK